MTFRGWIRNSLYCYHKGTADVSCCFFPYSCGDPPSVSYDPISVLCFGSPLAWTGSARSGPVSEAPTESDKSSRKCWRLTADTKSSKVCAAAAAPPGGCGAAAGSVRPGRALLRRRLHAVVVSRRGEARQADAAVGAQRVDALCVLAQHHAIVELRAFVHIWRGRRRRRRMRATRRERKKKKKLSRIFFFSSFQFKTKVEIWRLKSNFREQS